MSLEKAGQRWYYSRHQQRNGKEKMVVKSLKTVTDELNKMDKLFRLVGADCVSEQTKDEHRELLAGYARFTGVPWGMS